jgi:hypothetical protein
MAKSAAVSFRVPALQREELARVAEREGVSDSEIVRRALRREIEAPEAGRLDLAIDPELAAELLDTAARMGRRSEELLAALLRTYLSGLTEADVDPDKVREDARAKAREALRSV